MVISPSYEQDWRAMDACNRSVFKFSSEDQRLKTTIC